MLIKQQVIKLVADPGFPVEGGRVDLRHGCFSAKMYAKMKELGPIGGVRLASPLDPPMLTTVKCHGMTIFTHNIKTIALISVGAIHFQNITDNKQICYMNFDPDLKSQVDLNF